MYLKLLHNNVGQYVEYLLSMIFRNSFRFTSPWYLFFKETGTDYIRGHLVSLPVFVRSVMIIFQVLCIVIGCFICLRSVSYARCCLFLWGVHSWLSLLFSPTFIYSVCLYLFVCPLMITLINATQIIVI